MYLITKTLGDVEEMLSGGDFFRIHKQFLVKHQPYPKLYTWRWRYDYAEPG